MSDTTVSTAASDYQFITDPLSLDRQVQHWLNEPFLAIDTEFMRTNTFFAKPGLIQIADSQAVFIIDPLKVTDLSPLATLLENGNIVKIMHSMSEDFELLYHATGAKAQPVFDTQTAAAFLGYGPSLGYQKLVSDVLGIDLDKSETRSDWLKRPLTASQLEYAAKDAEYLVLLYRKLEQELMQNNLLACVFDEARFTISQTLSAWQNPELAYLKLRGAWELSESSQRLLQSLVCWRDAKARKEDVPKPWVFSDANLMQVVESLPVSLDELKQLKGIQFKSLRLYGDKLLKQIVEFTPDISSPFLLIERPVKGAEMVLYKKIKQIVVEVSQQSGIETQLLGSRKMLEAFVIHTSRHKKPELPYSYSGWRKKWVGDRIYDALVNESC